MPFPQGPVSKLRATRAAPAQARHGGPVFGVGMRAFVSDAGSLKGLVALNDASGKVAVGHLADGAEVEILAWIPRRAATVYCVQSTENHLAGWLGVANLRAGPGPAIISSPMPAPTPPAWISLLPPSAKPPPAHPRKALGGSHSEGLTGAQRRSEEPSDALHPARDEDSGKRPYGGRAHS